MSVLRLLLATLKDFLVDYGIYIVLVLSILLLTSCTSLRCTSDDECSKVYDKNKTFKLIRTIITQGTSR